MDIDAIFAADREQPPSERSPLARDQRRHHRHHRAQAHWASDMRAFRAEAREYCAYADWAENGARARFFGHIDTCGDDLIRKARALVAREIADGHWS
jgi:hypothetical protein